MLGALERTGRIIELFTTERPEWGVSEVARALGTTKSVAHAALVSMVGIGLLRRTAGARYRLGWRLVSLSHDLLAGDGVVRAARPVIDGLADRVGDTVHLAAFDGRHVVYLARAVGRWGLDISAARTGSRLPGHCSGVGKILLAGLPEGQVAELVERDGLHRRASGTLTDGRALHAQLDEVRSTGVAHDRHEALDGVACVAVPVTDPDGEQVAALSVSGPAQRILGREAAYLEAVRGAAIRLRHQLTTSGR